MAFMGNTSQAYSHNEDTVREDLQDYLTIASPVDMPLFSLLSTRPITQRQFEWAMDDITFDNDPANIAGDTAPEGKDAVFEAHVPRSDIFNFAQINTLSVDVSDTSRVVEMAGVPDEYVYQLWKKLLQIGRIMDMAAHFAEGANHTGNQSSSSGRVTHGLFRWIAQTGLRRAQIAASQPGVGSTETMFTAGPVVNDEFYSSFYNSAGADITRAILFENILAPAWRNGFIVAGAVGLCGARLKKMISDFTLVQYGPVNHRHIPARLNTLIDTIDVIETPLGRVYINMDRYMDISQSITFTGYGVGASPAGNIVAPINESLLFIQPEYFRIAVLRGLGFKPLADVGDSSKGMLVGEWGLQVDNPIYGCGGTNLD